MERGLNEVFSEVLCLATVQLVLQKEGAGWVQKPLIGISTKPRPVKAE